MSSRILNLLAFIVIALLLLASVYLQVYDNIQPCPLCTLQRLTFGLLALFFLLGALLPYHRLIRLFINLSTLTIAILGAGLAGRQIWLQYFASTNTECGASLQYLLQMLPWHEALLKVLAGSAECTERGFQFLFLDMAEWSFFCFLGFALLAIYLLLKDITKENDKH